MEIEKIFNSTGDTVQEIFAGQPQVNLSRIGLDNLKPWVAVYITFICQLESILIVPLGLLQGCLRRCLHLGGSNCAI